MRTWCWLVVMMSISFSGCTKEFLGGTAGGILGAGAGYEYKANQELKRIKEDLEEGRISQEEYNFRKDQIERMSLTQ